MSKRHVRNLLYGGGSLLMALAFTGTVSAQSTAQVFQANLTQLNTSGTSGTATVRVEGDKATVTVNTTGASANLAHATHIRTGGTGSCPANPTGTNKDGEPNTISTKEAEKSFGTIAVSLTTSGDVAPGSALAVDRMPKADANGRVSYTRTFTLPKGVTASSMSNAVVVQHGIAKLTGDKTKYDGSKKSDLNPDLPAEATLPAACGKLTAAPAGGVATGGGSTAGIEHSALFGIGAVALIASGVITLAHLRRTALAARKQ